MAFDFRHIRKLLPDRKAPKGTRQLIEGSIDSRSLLSLGLPVELWHLIVSFVDTPSLLALCRTSKAVYTLASPAFYQDIDIGLGDSHLAPQARWWLDKRKSEILCKSLQNECLASLVTKFQVALPNCKSCRNIRWEEKCDCDHFETILGRIIPSLNNLKSLQMICWRGCSFSGTRHSYLERLSTRQLRTVRIGCRCKQSDDIPLYQIFNAPCMKSITTVCVDFVNRLQPHHNLNEEILPHISKLMTEDFGLVRTFVESGNVTHIVCKRHNNDLLNVISEVSRSPAKPSRYWNLRHVGGFTFYLNTNDSVIPYMTRLSCLPKLASVEMHLVNSSFHQGERPSHNKLICDLGQKLANLRKVYLLTSWIDDAFTTFAEYAIWELDDENWHPSVVNGFTSWEILQDL